MENQQQEQLVLYCQDSIEGILTGVYEAFYSDYQRSDILLSCGPYVNQSLLAKTIDVPVDLVKAAKVADAIQKKISTQAYEQVYYVSQANPFDVVNKSLLIYRFLQKGFRTGKNILNDLADTDVLAMANMNKSVAMEYERTRQFLHFKEMQGNVLYGVIAPKHHQLLLIAEHFEDRYPRENYIIYDKNRGDALVHKAGEGSYIYKDFPVDSVDRTHQDDYIELWKTFFTSIAIEGRTNMRLQKAHVPKRFRQNMAEFNNWRYKQ